MKTYFKTLLSIGILSLTLTGCGGNSDNNNGNNDDKYTVTWKNYDGTILETDTNVEKGTIPTYDGETPVRLEDENYTYTFSGSWNPEVIPVTADAVYIAVYESTAKKRFEYQGIEFTGSDCFSEELNNALKELLNSKNFTLKKNRNGGKETVTYNAGYTDDTYTTPLTYSLDIFDNENSVVTQKFDNENYVTKEKAEAGDIYVLEADILNLFGLDSWNNYVAFNEQYNRAGDNLITEILKNSRSYSNSINLENFKISSVTPLDGKIVLGHIDSDTFNGSFCYDKSVGQFYQYSSVISYGYKKHYDSYWGRPQYSVIDDIIDSIKWVKADYVAYNFDTKEYTISWLGSGGRPEIRWLSPIKLDDAGHIISAAGYEVIDKGTTEIIPDFSMNTCVHEHLSEVNEYFDEDYHCVYCDDCGKIVSWEEHDADNEFGYCETCEHYIGLEDYSPEYLTDDISCSYYLGKTKNGKVVITGDGKGGYSPAYPEIEGADGKTYIIGRAIPENKTEKVIMNNTI